MDKRLITLIVILIVVITLAVGYRVFTGDGKGYYDKNREYLPISKNNTFSYIENHPAFKDFSEFIQPWKDTKNRIITPYLPLNVVCATNYVDADSITEGLNFLVQQSQEKDIFFDIYSEEEREEDSTKEHTGLYFIPGDTEKPFVLLVSGGAFRSVCNFLEAFPVSRLMHEAGYNVFILQYRVDPKKKMELNIVETRQQIANSDFGRAMQYIFECADELGITTDNYAVCGFSAGGRLCQMWGLDNEYGYKYYGIPRPAASMLIYSGWDDPAFEGCYNTQPPAYFAHVKNDKIIGDETSKKIDVYISKLKELGISVEEHVYAEAMHGFGAGEGTGAEGWTEDAIAFWETHMQ